MTRAVFFDWFNTLTTYYPPREDAYAAACRDLGCQVTPGDLRRGLLLADQFYSGENGRLPLKERSAREIAALRLQYGQVLLRGAGLPSDPDTVLRVMEKMRGRSAGPRFALYSDVLPALREMKARGLVMGIISNIDRDIRPACLELGLGPYIAHVVTSKDVGSEKPRPPIFRAALKKAGVKAAEAVYVGDQPDCDVVGARSVGMKPVLIDRDDLFPRTVDCLRLRSLEELAEHIRPPG